MKAVNCTQYGSPEVLKLVDTPKPTPHDDEILIKVHASVVTPSDTAFRKGDPFIIKLIYGLSKPRNPKQGVEYSGVIEAIGKDVTTFNIGDMVFGMEPDSFGAHADYICVKMKKPMALKATTVTHAEMVGILDGASTARTFLQDTANVQPGQKVLINGASGSVGAYGVQIAKMLGAEVTGVCSGANVELVKSLGADHVIDYTKTDFTKTGQTYDVIFDAVGKHSFGECKKALTKNGQYLTTVPTLGMLAGLIQSLFTSKKAKFTTAGLKQSNVTLTTLKEWTEVGKLKAVIDRQYPLTEIIEAHRYVETGRKKGNVIITVAS
jgi:NADPH:quinone reductase-like Zn-dependent oxidoreductase